ncbi:hypothetical protein RJ640_017293 [Escallonia rubra]|uniref:GDSL esterase/lipase n=1 Tax=Escallonia rubra TaxID=112253 RepID=A0AA88RR32_9ASTE|nr:hypothetical protein RJ640_017293 [Escallonia rubra]
MVWFLWFVLKRRCDDINVLGMGMGLVGIGFQVSEAKSWMKDVLRVGTSDRSGELIELGAVTLMVPGNLPIGCSSSYLTLVKGSNKEEYGPEIGCLTWLNKFAEYHNELLRIELNQMQQRNPHTTIIYADYYNTAMQLYRSPKNFGFTRGALSACYGGGGSYNYNPLVQCGILPSTVSGEPSLFIFWDGLHLTEATYRWIFRGLFEGPYTVPHISSPVWLKSKNCLKSVQYIVHSIVLLLLFVSRAI